MPLAYAAPITKNPNIEKKLGMAYNMIDNYIEINPKILNKSKSTIFALLKHEYLHQVQNYYHHLIYLLIGI